MPGGTPVSRQWILVLSDGRAVIDWGAGQFQDLLTGEMVDSADCALALTAQDIDLQGMHNAGLVDHFDETTAFVIGLPDRPNSHEVIP